MSEAFFTHPILNSPYEYPNRHWRLDDKGQPTQEIIESRRRAEFVTPIPKPRQHSAWQQGAFVLGDGVGISSEKQQYDKKENVIINRVRHHVDRWRLIPDSAKWGVTPETARLLHHWRHHKFSGVRPFFCQIEAVETAIWLTEVAPHTKEGKDFLEHLKSANREANPEIMRLALKLATGAGKTTVMAMLIAWQTVNAVRRPNSKNFTRGFLLVTPGLTIRDRLRVLQPNDPDSYYASREMLPSDMLPDLARAKIVITNYHAFKLRERLDLSKGGRSLLQGRGDEIQTLETEGQMIQRVMPELMGMKNIIVMNDEAHHCYREKPPSAKEDSAEEDLSGEEKKEAEKNNEAARLWISGIEAVNRKIGVARVMDLSATPFFLRGSGYREGTLFPWTMSDFSLMDAIECGIVKLPRVPVADNIPGGEMPKFRELWKHIGKKMPKKGRGSGQKLDPLDIPVELQTALDALYGHYEKTFDVWAKEGISVPPCFIVVCNNTATSKLVYDYISGFTQENTDGSQRLTNGRLALFRNYDDYDNPYPRPRTILIDSEQLESGEALDASFRTIAADEIDRFRRDIIERTGDLRAGESITDSDLLREVMNTVGKTGRLGQDVRCVVSVSMLTEGWDTNTVTHILGVRAFGTQLLCEQVIGRALRRQSYDLNEEGKFNVEYADILGIPFDFNAKPVVAPPPKPRETVQVKAIRPQRDALEIRFPRVLGYRVELPEERLTATFNDDSTLILTPEIVGATNTRNEGIIGEGIDLTLHHKGDIRTSTLLMHLTKHLLYKKWRDQGEDPKLHLFGQLKRITKAWLDHHLVCKGGTYPAQLMYQELADRACERITAAITKAFIDTMPIKAVVDPYNPMGSTRHVNFNTSKTNRWDTLPGGRCHLNWVILDSDWEAEFCRITDAEALAEALDYPWDKWAVFLHPAQADIASRDFSGPARVSGSAGTGKTVVALHRAVSLASRYPESHVLLTTFSPVLAEMLKAKVRRLLAANPKVGDRLEVADINAVAVRLYESAFGRVQVAAPADILAAIHQASAAVPAHSFTERFLFSEWQEVVDAWQIQTWEEYRDVRRLGRKIRLPETQRATLWAIFERTLQYFRASGLVTYAAIFTRLAAAVKERQHPPFTSIVVDEAQDISIAQLRFLAAVGGEKQNALFFAGDLGQRIFQTPFSWRSLGVDIRGRSRTLTINYRTSHQIRNQADRLLAPAIADVDGVIEERKGTISVFNGPAPEIYTAQTENEEAAYVAKWLQRIMEQGVAPDEIAVFVRSSEQFARASKAIEQADLSFNILDSRSEARSKQVTLSTMHQAKGLEFKAVAVMACDDEIIPLQERMEEVTDDTEIEDFYNTERHLLYVAVTRARDLLLVTSVEPKSEFIDDLLLV